jgi:hypothetical protein
MHEPVISQEIIKKTRPRSILIAVLLQVIQGLGLLGAGVYQLLKHGWALSETVWGWRFIPFPLFESLSSGVILTVLGLFTLIVALTFLALKEWAWLAAMTMQGLGLLFGLIGYVLHRPNYIGMALGILIVLYLNNREVLETFRLQRGR